MKITIDTKEDSHEEIKKAIKMLSNLVNVNSEEEGHKNIFEDSALPNTNVFGNILDQPSDTEDNEKQSNEPEEVEKEEDADYKIEVVEY